MIEAASNTSALSNAARRPALQQRWVVSIIFAEESRQIRTFMLWFKLAKTGSVPAWYPDG
jgi:hypothetical protein